MQFNVGVPTIMGKAAHHKIILYKYLQEDIILVGLISMVLFNAGEQEHQA